MATDSATLERRVTAPRRAADAPKIHSPAEPIARGMGLDRPFFDDKNRAFWILQTIGWTGYFFLRTLSGFANSMGWMLLVHTLLLTATGYSLTLLLASLFRRLIKMTPVWTLLLSLGAVVLASGIFSAIETWSYATFLKPGARPVGIEYFGAIILDFSLLAAWTALYYGINYFLLLEDQIRQREKLEGAASSAQLAMLRYQLNPHFLFNTLNAISTLILDGQGRVANQAVGRLSDFLRYTLDQDPMKKVTLRHELDALNLYLGIEQLRFGDRLHLEFDIDDDVTGALVPSLILQPLVENSLKYAVAPREEGGRLRIEAREVDGRLRLVVQDDGPGLPVGVELGAGRGVGFRNTRERLAVLYGDQQQLSVRFSRPGLRLEITMPFERATVPA